MNLVYGPVPSRRLGISLGVDIVPPKVCSLDCVYCQLGRTTVKSAHPEGVSFPGAEEVLTAVRSELDRWEGVDYITISGSGEPTLNPELPQVVAGLMEVGMRVALITNSTMLHMPEVMEAASEVDVLLPSLDAGNPRMFRAVNRPASGVDYRTMVEALRAVRRSMRGTMRLEVMLLEGRISSASEEHLEELAERIRYIRPHTVDVNTPVRPPCESWVRPLTQEELGRAVGCLRNASSPVPVEHVHQHTEHSSRLRGFEDAEERVLALLRVRPCTVADIHKVTGIPLPVIGKLLQRLSSAGKIRASGDHYTASEAF